MNHTSTIATILFFYLTLFIAELVYSNNAMSAETTPTLPQPEKLISGWWDYFDVSEELLAKRIEEAKQQYPRIQQGLPVVISEAASTDLHSFLSNLNVLYELQKTSVNVALPALPIQQSSYSITEWLNSANELRKAEWDLQKHQIQLTDKAVALEIAQKRLNTLMLDYISAKFGDSNKTLIGLSIMANRSAIALGEEQLKLDKALLEQQLNNVNKLRQLIETATDRLKTDQEFVQQLQQQLQELQKKIKQAQDATQKILIETLGVVEQNPLALSESDWHHQQVINAMIEENELNLQIMVVAAEKNLALLLLDEQTDMTPLSDEMQQWKQQQQQDQQNALNWEKETTNELNQVQEAMIRLTVDSVNNEAMDWQLKQRLKTAQDGLVGLKQMEVNNNTLDRLTLEINNRLVQRSGKLLILFDWTATQLLELKNKFVALWTEPLFSIGDMPVTTAGIARVIIIISIAALISSLFQRVIQHLITPYDKYRHGRGASLFYTVGRLGHYVILLVGIIIALSSVGLDFTNLALVIGALSVGIGFGLQSTVNNFVSGLILLFEGTIKVGDFIELDGNIRGVVYEINVRSTQISTLINGDIIVPNSTLASNQVINWTLRKANYCINIPFSVAYGSSKELVEKAVLEAAANVHYTRKANEDESAQCWLVKFGQSSLDFELVVWINREAIRKRSMVQAAYLWEIESCLTKYQIKIPFPQLDLHIQSTGEQ